MGVQRATTVSHLDIFPVYRPIDATASSWFTGFAQGPADMGELRLYEHSTTGRRLALDRNGGAYRWFVEIGGYSRVDYEQALIETLV